MNARRRRARAQPRTCHKITRSAWMVDHDDTVPTVLSGIVVAGGVLTLLATVAPWLTAVLVMAPVAIVVALHQVEGWRRANRIIEAVRADVRRTAKRPIDGCRTELPDHDAQPPGSPAPHEDL